MRFMPLVWSAIWRHRTESLLTLFALTVAFTLFGALLALTAAYEEAIVDARMDRLFVTRRFDGPTALPMGYRGLFTLLVCPTDLRSRCGGFISLP